MNKFKIVSGFTINTPYEKEIETLIESIKKPELNYDTCLKRGNDINYYSKNIIEITSDI